MCLAANIPLIESGSAGYLGQVHAILKGQSECYECHPKPAPKQYPTCTIRNTPSAMIHCVVWAKFLFNHLYGEADPDNDVAPNPDDPELRGDEGASEVQAQSVEKAAEGQGKRGQVGANSAVDPPENKSTRQWAEENEFDPKTLLNKLFVKDVKVLLTLESLWKTRAKPLVMDIDAILACSGDVQTSQVDTKKLPDQRVWTLKECLEKFLSAAEVVRNRCRQLKDGDFLTWDKDDDDAMDFLCAAANIRAHVFHIDMQSRFDLKSMAGNIIPAIATTNAVVAGLIVTEAYKIVAGNPSTCREVYVCRQPMSAKLLSASTLPKPNPQCIACGARPTACVTLNLETTTVQSLVSNVLKKRLSLVQPEVALTTGKVIVSVPEDEEEEEIMTTKIFPRTLASFGMVDGVECKVSDEQQAYTLTLLFRHSTELPIDEPFQLSLSHIPASDDQDQASGNDSATTTEPQSAISSSTSGDTSSTSAKRGPTSTSSAESAVVVANSDAEEPVQKRSK
eukprot:m.246172 g.246172  ORF g.246172 m.246172 type:complete len:508 (+) comp15374_c1_seq19:896-2419(+)